MRLNMQIIIDDLKGLFDEACLNGSNDLNLLGCRRLEKSDNSGFSPEYLYIGAIDDFLQYDDYGNLSAVICIGDKKIEELPLGDHIDIVRSSSTSLEYLKKIVEDIFEKYEKWNETFISAIFEGVNLQTLADIAAEIFHNPFSIADASTRCLAKSGRVPPDYDDQIWNMINLKNYVLIDDLFKLINEKTSGDKYYREARLIKNYSYRRDGNRFDALMTNIIVEDDRVGNFGMNSVWEPITDGQCRLSEYFTKMISYVFAREHLYSNYSDPLNQIFINLLSGKPYSSELFEIHADQFTRRIGRSYQLHKVNFLDSENKNILPMEETYRSYFKRRLSELKKNDDIIVSFEDSIVYLEALYPPEPEQTENLAIRLIASVADNSPVVIGTSNVFEDFSDLQSCYYQAHAAMKTGIKCEPDKNIYRFFNFAVEFLISIYLNSNKPEAFCHPDVLKLYKYDKQHGTEYLKTITVMYTFSGRLTRAAKALHLHRNSLMYRIDRIKEILGIDAYDEDYPLYFLLSSHIMQFASS